MTLPLVVLDGPPPELPRCLWQRTVPSRPELKLELIEHITTVLIDHGLWTEEDGPWLTMCLDEAIVNGMLHGNEADETVPLQVHVGVQESGAQRRWLIRIDDQGAGFAPTDVPDQEDADSLLLEHGRGIRLMREWLDELRYYRHGATIIMGRDTHEKRTCGPSAAGHPA